MVAGTCFFLLILLVLVCATAYMLRAAWLSWRHPERAPRLQLTRSSNPSVIRGHERGVLPFAGFMFFLTALLIVAPIVSALAAERNLVVKVAAGACLAGLMLSLLLHASVAWFNWPKFLVPPHLRADTGSVAEWHRHRRDLRAALERAAERDAPGPRSGPR